MSSVLIVDDEPDIRFLMRLILEGAGHQVAEASNGEAALEAIRRSRPDLLVTDIMMPVINGHVLIARVRSDPETATIPILVVSSEISLGNDADARLRKPFTAARLIENVKALLAKEVSL